MEKSLFDKVSVEELSEPLSTEDVMLTYSDRITEARKLIEQMPCSGNCSHTAPYICDRCKLLKILEV